MPTARFHPYASLPAHLQNWERLDSTYTPNTADLVDEPWRHFAPLLAARGYTLCWRYYSRHRPETPARTRALPYAVAQDPLRPRNGEGFVHLYDTQLCGIHQTTGWLTQTASLKMAYDSQDRVCAIKALHNERSRDELDILAYLNTPKLRAAPGNHTIPVLDTIVTEDFTFVVMPYWPRSVQACIPWEVDDYFRRIEQALEGLAFLHRHGIIHRDISSGNLLLNMHSIDAGVYAPLSRRGIALAYIDFGCAVRFPVGERRKDPSAWMGTGQWGTMEHAAPEVPRAGDSGSPYHLPPVDVYALGSVLKRALSWEQMYCKTFGNPSSLPTAASTVLTHYVPGYTALLERMTHPDPLERPSAEEALREAKKMRGGLDGRVRWAPRGGYPALQTPTTE
ncbi:kinase-like domain-containing protein [Roridomyces roridus]|uniref:Kinase-like domain-containing protein n=1 Tax=Roridomyces roridus TaxID=1738132 RepID=A0AAD7C0T6_9AGAR|nr:kinase-like domain-containing protein [Roridomyces roridus]